MLRVEPWWDPGLAISGHDPTGAYVERYWLPVLGPAATLALRSLATGLRQAPAGFEVSVVELTRSLGLGAAKRGRNAPTPRAIERLCYFSLAREHHGALQVRTHVPTLAPHHCRRLPDGLRELHATFVATRRPS